MPELLEQFKDLQQQRCKLVVQARKILDTAYAEKREMRAEENEQYDKIMREVDSLKERMDKCERVNNADDTDDDADTDTEEGDDDEERDDEEEDDERSVHNQLPPGWRKRKAKRDKRPRTQPGGGTAARGGDGAQLKKFPWETPVEFRTRCRRSTDEYHQVFNHYLLDGDKALGTNLARRAIQADSDIVGGYLVAPQEFVGRLIKFVDNILFIRRLATKYTVKSAQSLGSPSLDVDIADADWTSELDSGNEDTAMAFGKRELTPRPLAKRLKVSNKLLRAASITGGFSADGSAKGGGPEGLVRYRLGYKFGVAQEKAFMTGNGANQPLGMFTASTRGIDTSRDVLTGSSTGFTTDGLINAKYNQKVQYWPNLAWVIHRTGLQLIRQLKDGNGQYLWIPSGMGSVGGFSQGADTKKIGDMLLDFPVYASEYTPNTYTTGLYAGLLGDMSFYWICDSEVMTIQRLVELYAAANQTGFIARQELDGMPVLAEAFTRLKCN